MTLSLTQRAALTVLYSETHRHYHTLTHIRSCLRELSEIPESLVSKDRKRTIEVAIWFHDAVYDPQAHPGTNEQESAELFSRSHDSNLGISSATVESMILATRDHKIPTWDVSLKDLIPYFLDIDLSILGKDDGEYDLYAKQIRDEYAFVPLLIYRDERMKILKNLYARPSIYFTDHFRTKYEKRARENIRNEARFLDPRSTFDFPIMDAERTGFPKGE